MNILQLFRYQKAKRQLPLNWNSLSLRDLMWLCKLQCKTWDEPYDMRKALAYRMLDIPPKLFFSMNGAQLLDVISLQDFLFESCDLTNFLISKIKSWKTYYGPGDGMKNTTVAEIAWADSYLQQYDTSKLDEDLCRVIAALYRPTNPVRLMGWLINGTDIRAHFNDKTAERRAKKFRRLPEHVKLAIYYQVKGCRTAEVRDNPELYKALGDAEPSPFGWAGLIVNMSNSTVSELHAVEKMDWQSAIVMLKKLDWDRQRIENKINGSSGIPPLEKPEPVSETV